MASGRAGCETQRMITTLKTLLTAVALTLTGSLVLVAQSVLAQESSQTHDLILQTGTSATLTLSALDRAPRGIVVMIHGWSGQKDEVGGLFKRQAEALAQQGLYSLRMDIRGESEREKSGFRLTSTFKSRINDALAGADWAAKTYPDLPIGLLGFSYGGATAMALIGKAPERYQSVVFWSTIINPSEIITDDPKGGPFRAAIEHGEGYVEAFTRLTITREHVLGMIGYNPLDGLKHYSGALLSIRGSLDSVPRHDPRILKAAGQAAGEYRIIHGADHLFNVFDPGANFDLRLIRQTTRWFEDTL
ncbi:MAG: alpha/beta hydrolase family protein [Candidatus Azotimanducaceae bacterium]